MSTAPHFGDRPTYTAEEIANNPWYTVELKIYAVLDSVLQSTSSPSTVTAAQDLNTLFWAHREESGEGFLWEFWNIFAIVASKIPYQNQQQGRLVDLIKELRDLPNPVDLNLENWGSVKIWTDLPLLGPVFREALDVLRDVNLEAFLAQITQEGVANWSWLGLVALHSALEVEPDHRARAHKEKWQVLDEAMPRAVMWLKIAGAKLYEEVKAGALSDKNYASGGSWKGPAGFSKARWNYWRGRFGEIAVHEQPSEETKVLARNALEIMAEFER